MKIGTLFDLFTDAKDLCALFDNVETREQLVSRLEFLKHKDTDELLECLAGARASLDRMYQETFEMNASVSEGDGESLNDLTDGDNDIDQTLAELAENFPDVSEEVGTENPISEPAEVVADPKSAETPEV